MNPGQPSREQIETRITALLLGELPAEEAALLRYTIAQDTALQQLHDELQATLVLVREAARNPEEPNRENQVPLRLSAERRQKLLAHFQTPRPKRTPGPLSWLKPIKVSPLIPVLVGLTVLVLLAAMLLPSLSAAKSKGRRVTILGMTAGLEDKNSPADNEAREVKQAGSAPLNQPAVMDASAHQTAARPTPVPNAQVYLPQPAAAPEVAAQSGPTQSSSYEFRAAGNAPSEPPATIPPAEPMALREDKVTVATVEHASEPVAIKLGPEPQVAPPPAGLPPAPAVLTPGELTRQLTARNAATSQVYSQNNVGYVNVEKPAQNQWVVPDRETGAPKLAVNQNANSPGGEFGGGGGGGGVVARPRLQGDAAQFKRNGYYEGFYAPQAATGAVAANDSDANRTFVASNAYQGEQGTPGNAAERRRPIAAGMAKTIAVTPLPAPATATPPPGAAGALPSEASREVAMANPPENSAWSVGAVAREVHPDSSAELPKKETPIPGAIPTVGALFQNGDASIAKAPALAAVPPSATAAPAPAPAGGALNLAENQREQDVFVFSMKPGAPVQMMATNDASRVNLGDYGLKSYDEAKRQLEQKREVQKLLYAKLEAEKVDLDLPKNSLVQITDPAVPNRQQTFWQHLTGKYASAARVKVENDVSDIQGMSATPIYAPYDPYFIQTTFEIIQSDFVLSNVVNRLHLQSAWAGKNGGQPLTMPEAVSQLKSKLDLQPVRNTKLISIQATSDDPNEAASLANAVAQAYKDYRFASRRALTSSGIDVLKEQYEEQAHDIQTNQAYLEQLGQELRISAPARPANSNADKADLPLRKPAPNTPAPQPEVLTRTNAFSTFALNVSDVSFKLAEAGLQNNKLPDTASIRSEEFINAFDYRDPEAAPGQPMAFTAERARYPFAHNRELLRFAIKTAAAGRQPGRALNLVLLLDVSGSMERADRVAIIHEALRALAAQLQAPDTVSVVTFARTARLWADGISGDKAGDTLARVGEITPEGGTNLEEAMRLAYEAAHRHYLANGMNRVVLLTDGAANLGDADPEALRAKVEAQRRQGIALDCFGIGWEDYNDDLLEVLSSHGDGRYAFLNSPEDASRDFAAKLAGALQIAAADLKVQVEFNPARVIAYRQIGYATHQLTREQFRDNTVAAGEIAAQEAGNALYTIETSPGGEGPVATVRVRYRVPGTTDYREHSWEVPYTGNAPALEKSSPAMRLAATAGAFSEWLAASPYAQDVTPDELLRILNGVPEVYGADDRPKQLETMIREAKSLAGQ